MNAKNYKKTLPRSTQNGQLSRRIPLHNRLIVNMMHVVVLLPRYLLALLRDAPTSIPKQQTFRWDRPTPRTIRVPQIAQQLLLCCLLTTAITTNGASDLMVKGGNAGAGAITFSPQGGRQGQTMKFAIEIANVGKTIATASTTRFQIKDVATLKDSAVDLDELTPSIGAGASLKQEYQVLIPVSTKPGRYAAYVALDRYNTAGQGPTKNDYGSSVEFDILPSLPAITGVSPSSGSVKGGELVTISGSDLLEATSVKVGGSDAAIVNRNATTGELIIKTPAHADGTVEITVTAPGGSVTANNAYKYIAPAPLPQIVSVTGIPSQVNMNESFTVSIIAVNNGGRGGQYSSISASIVCVDGTHDFIVTDVNAPWAENGSPYSFIPGTQIRDRNCSSLKSVDHLVEAQDNDWITGEQHVLTFTVTPTKAEKLLIRVRSTLRNGDSGCDYRNAIAGGGLTSVDQQGWEVGEFSITTTPVCTYELSPTSVTLPSAESVGSFEVIASDGYRFYFQMHSGSIKGPQVIEFPRHLQRHGMYRES